MLIHGSLDYGAAVLLAVLLVLPLSLMDTLLAPPSRGAVVWLPPTAVAGGFDPGAVPGHRQGGVGGPHSSIASTTCPSR